MKSLKNLRLTDKKRKLNLDSYLNVQKITVKGKYTEDTPAAIVYKATWPDEKVMRCTVGTLYETAKENNITKTALIIVGDVLDSEYSLSRLYADDFSTEFREAKK